MPNRNHAFLHALAALLFAGRAAAGVIAADMEGGAGTGAPDQVPGIAGAGWTGAWTNGNLAVSNIAFAAADTPSLTPNSGRFLSATVAAVNADAGLGRQFNTSSATLGVDGKKAVAIKFDFRLDSANSGFTGSTEHITLQGNTGGLVSSSGTSTWMIRVAPGATPRWGCYNGGRDGGSYSATRIVDAGMSALPGVTYSFTINLDPATRTYSVSIANGTDTVNVGGLGFRTSSATLGDTFGIFARKDSAADTLAFALDRLSIVGESPPSVPPPETFPYVFDMVGHTPGEAYYESRFNDPAYTRVAGFTGKVYSLFESPLLAVNWDEFNTTDKVILPAGSADRAWVDAKRAEITPKLTAARDAGLKVYAMSDLILLPKRLVSLYGLATTFGNINNADTELWLRRNLRLMFAQYPQLDGIMVRIGETYLQDAPYHQGKIDSPSSATTIIPLMNILRDEVCVKLNKQIFFRTWNSFDTNLATFLAVSDAVEPHSNLIWSIKHCEGDFHRGNPYSKVLGQGRHPFIVEVQAAREYEGKGAFPNYIARGVIEGFEEHAANPTQNIRYLWQNSPLMRGAWTWSRGGGWRGPYIRNELWCELNAWVMANWALAPATPEETIFNRFAIEKLGLPQAQLPAFRRLCLLSAEAVWRWKRGSNNGLISGWSRDQYYTFPTLPATAAARAVVLASQDEAVSRFEEIVALAKTLTPADSMDREFIVSSSVYGLRLMRMMRAVVRLKAAEVDGDAYANKVWMDRHDEAWADYLALAQQYPNSLSTFYTRNAWQTWGGENPATAEPRLRSAAVNTLAAYAARDGDGDGVSDADELGRYWDQPFDSDGDGVPDYLQAGVRPRAFERWLQEKFSRDYDQPALSGPRQDPDGDGVPNLLEFALGADPLRPSHLPVSGSARTDTGALGLEFSPNGAADDLVLEVHASEDLLAWAAVARSTDGGAFSPLLSGWSVGAGSAAGSVRVEKISSSPEPRRFLRLSVGRSTP